MTVQSTTKRGEARRVAILAAARACFLRDGFHATSMQDLLKASGLSAGAFYRYFPSKESLVGAIAESAFNALTGALDGAASGDGEPDFHALLCRVIRTVEQVDMEDGTARLAVMFWGEAQRSPGLLVTVRGAMAAIGTFFDSLATPLHVAGTSRVVVAPEHLATTLLGLVQGFMVQRALLGMSADDYCAGLGDLGARLAEAARTGAPIE